VIVWLPGGVGAEGELVEEREGGSSERSPLNSFFQDRQNRGGSGNLYSGTGSLGWLRTAQCSVPSAAGRPSPAPEEGEVRERCGGVHGAAQSSSGPQRRRAARDSGAGALRGRIMRGAARSFGGFGARRAARGSGAGALRGGYPRSPRERGDEGSGVGKGRKRGVSDRCGGGSGGSGGSRGCRR
jgi:hypothetical protein